MTTTSASVDNDRRKRLGQFFTGEALARILAALAGAASARTVIDPMGGSGDMLLASADIGAHAELLASIEIDDLAATASQVRFAQHDLAVRVVTASAFEVRSWRDLPESWDLVITNPPYVRYQTGSAAEVTDDIAIPSASDVRTSLLELIQATTQLTPDERDAYANCARTYSGLADLAVPAWLLCCLRVREGGRLAMVVPNTWLSRDYAAPVLYVLRRFFDIEYVVEDRDMSWFADALVRTNLVVARRVPDKGSPYRAGGHLRITLPRDARSDDSLVGSAFAKSPAPEQAFAEWAAAQHAERAQSISLSIEAEWSDEHDLIQAIHHAAQRHPALAHPGVLPLGTRVPERLGELLAQEPQQLATLSELGWTVGQGLRTGANDFFYVAGASPDGPVRSPLLPGEDLRLPPEVLRPAIRNQAEAALPAGGGSGQRSFVLVLNNWALPEDAERAAGPTPWHLMDGDLARLVRAAGAVSYERPGKTVRLPELSAVKTNARDGQRKPPRAARFWYQLPPLARRHRPALYVARVNSHHPSFRRNSDTAEVIDANFSTVWRTKTTAIEDDVLLTLLSSSWVAASLEVAGTVLGGGALKVEATHLRRLLLPVPSGGDVAVLAELARASEICAADRAVHDEIDRVVFRIAGAVEALKSVRALAETMLRKRCA